MQVTKPTSQKEISFYGDQEFKYLYNSLPEEFKKALSQNREIKSRDIKKLLKKTFPKTKFSVRTHGNSLRIEYTDGPALEKVEKVAKWESEGFNGMYDIGTSKRHLVLMPDGTTKELNIPWRFVFIERSYSEKSLKKAVKDLNFQDFLTVKCSESRCYLNPIGNVPFYQLQKKVKDYLRKIDL